MQLPIDAILAKIAALNAAKVEPLVLTIRPDSAAFFKYKAMEGHPSPGNAMNGFSHPAIQPGQSLNDIIKPVRVSPPNPIPVSPDELREAADTLAKAIGWEDARISIQVWLTQESEKERGTAGYLAEDMIVGNLAHLIPAGAEEIASWSVDLARGGALVWQDYYPGENAPLGARARYHKLKSDERAVTDSYMAKREKGRPSLSDTEETVVPKVPMPSSLWEWCKAQEGGGAEYIRGLVEADRKARE